MAARLPHTIAAQAARKAQAEAKRKDQAGTHCPIDGFRLRDVTVDGRLVTTCEGCARRKHHVCLDCRRTTTGRAWRCPTHQAANHRTRVAENRTREVERARERERESAKRRREKRTAYMRDWRAKNPLALMQHQRRARLKRERDSDYKEAA
jgi:hypothetical protein